MNHTFYICPHCGNIVTKIEDKNVPLMCCGQKMQAIVPNTTDAAQEKHVPVVTVNGNTVSVCVGSVAHPMTEAHQISWIALETNCGLQIRYLAPDSAPQACFTLVDGEEVTAVLAYCNLHGLWKA